VARLAGSCEPGHRIAHASSWRRRRGRFTGATRSVWCAPHGTRARWTELDEVGGHPGNSERTPGERRPAAAAV